MVVLVVVVVVPDFESAASLLVVVVVVVRRLMGTRRAVVGVVAADVGLLVAVRVVDDVVVDVVRDVGVVVGRVVREVGVGRDVGVGREEVVLLGVVRVAEGVVRDDRGVRVVVVVRVAEVEEGRDEGVVLVRVERGVRAVVRVAGVVLVVVVVLTAPPGVVRVVGRGVPGLTLEVAGVVLAEAGVVLAVGVVRAAPGVVRVRAAAAPVVRGAGFTGAFLAAESFSLVGGAISEIISSSLAGISALGVWMGDTGLSSIIGALTGVQGNPPLIGISSVRSVAEASGACGERRSAVAGSGEHTGSSVFREAFRLAWFICSTRSSSTSGEDSVF